MSTLTMFYKHPGIHAIHDDKFDYIIVDTSDAELFAKTLADGWFLTTTEAKEASGKPAIEIPTPEQTAVVAEYIETMNTAPRRGRPRKPTEVEVITDAI